MRKLVIFLAVALVSLAPADWARAGAPKPQEAPATDQLGPGAPAPPLTLKTMAGETVSLSQYRGQVVVLNFWATWCPPCRQEMPSMEKLNTLLDGNKFVMLAVSADDDMKTLEAFLKDNPHSFAVLRDPDGEAQETYGVYRLPETFIIGKDGIITDRVIGAIDWAAPDAVKYLVSLINKE